jgi:CopG antitoxin of type II toxin-antitoxin system
MVHFAEPPMKPKQNPKTKKLKPIPRFKSEKAVREFWETHDSTQYLDWSKAKRVRFVNLKPSR